MIKIKQYELNFDGEITGENQKQDKTKVDSLLSHSGQRLRLKILLLADSTEDQGEVDRLLADDSSRTCSTVLVVREPVRRRSRELAVCVGRSRVRPLYTSTGHELTVHVTAPLYSIHVGQQPRFLLIFEGKKQAF